MSDELATMWTTNEVLAGSNITFRILDYWIRMGVVIPDVEATGSGSRRMFSDENATRIRALGRVQAALLQRSQAGVSTVLLAEVMDAMRDGRQSIDLGEGVYLGW